MSKAESSSSDGTSSFEYNKERIRSLDEFVSLILKSLSIAVICGTIVFPVVGMLVVASYLRSQNADWALSNILLDRQLVTDIAILNVLYGLSILALFVFPSIFNAISLRYAYKDRLEKDKGLRNRIVRHDALVFLASSILFVLELFAFGVFDRWENFPEVFFITIFFVALVDVLAKGCRGLLVDRYKNKGRFWENSWHFIKKWGPFVILRWATILLIFLPIILLWMFLARRVLGEVDVWLAWLILGFAIVVLHVLYSGTVDLLGAALFIIIITGVLYIYVLVSPAGTVVTNTMARWGVAANEVKVFCLSDRCKKVSEILGNRPRLILNIGESYALGSSEVEGAGYWLTREDAVITPVSEKENRN